MVWTLYGVNSTPRHYLYRLSSRGLPEEILEKNGVKLLHVILPNLQLWPLQLEKDDQRETEYKDLRNNKWSQ